MKQEAVRYIAVGTNYFMNNSNHENGYSLMEVLMAIGVFSLLAVLVTQTLAITLRSAKKSDSDSRVRTTLDYAITVMERQLRNANSITSTCENGGTTLSQISYIDAYDVPASFSCIDDSGEDEKYVASNSARLTTPGIEILPCSFTCTSNNKTPDTIDINLTGRELKATGVESSQVTVQSRILLRNY